MNRPQTTAEFGGVPSLPNIGEVIAHKYRVDSVVGTGGMGVVLSATHLELGQSVAIKVLTIAEDDARRDEARERFLREGRATAALTSDHVVRVYDVGTLENGSPFMVMELLRGKDLAVALQQHGPLPIEHAADYVRQAAEAIACAHAQGIVHRDLKPSNLFLTSRSDGTPLVKVLDFGISKSMHAEPELVTGNLTAASSVLGTPFYMSPEQVRDAKKVDSRTDIWSLGLILHELLSGSPAFEGSTLPSVCARITADPPAALRLKRPEVPPELEAIVLKCLEKDPTRRYQTARDLGTQLVPWSGRSESSTLLSLGDRTVRSASFATGLEALAGPTVALTPSNSGTMASAVFTQSAERAMGPGVVADKAGLQTLAEAPGSGLLRGTLASPTGGGAGKPAWALWVAGLLALVALVAIVLRGFGGAHPAPAPANVPEAAQIVPPREAPGLSFSVQIESNPMGAQVYEGQSLLGTTPLRISIQSASVATGPRTFTIRKAGYTSYTLVQGASPKDSHVLAELAPDPAAPSTSSTLPATRSAPKAKQARELKVPTPAPKAAGTPSDIFMQR